MKVISASWTGTSLNWHGVIKFGRDTVWTCAHSHHNRNHSSYSTGQSAHECAREVLRVAQMPVAEAGEYARFLPRSTAINARASVRYALGLDVETEAA